VKTRKITIKRGETEIVVTTEDIYAWFIGLVMLVLAGTIAVLFLLGRTQDDDGADVLQRDGCDGRRPEAATSFTIAAKNQKAQKMTNYSRVPLLFSFANTKYA